MKWTVGVLLLCVGWLAGSDQAAAQFGRFRPFESPPGDDFSLAVTLHEADNVSRSHLERVDKFLADGQWEEAIDALRQVMEDGGDQALRPVATQIAGGGRFARYLTLRDHSQMRLAEMHVTAPDALALYRRQVDPLAERWFHEAREQRTQEPLEKIVDRLFLSSFGDDAAFRLGEIFLEQGRFTLARAAWEGILPTSRAPQSVAGPLVGRAELPWWLAVRGLDVAACWSEIEPALAGLESPPAWLAYPDTSLDAAAIRARLVLVSILEGATDRARVELDLLRRLHPDATGTLAGKEGKLADLLDDWLAKSAAWSSPPREAGWRTFAGAQSRNGAAERAVDPALWPIWSVRLPVIDGRRDLLAQRERRVSERPDAIHGYFPVVVGDRVLLQTGESIDEVRGWHLHSGAPLWPDDAAAMTRGPDALEPRREIDPLVPAEFEWPQVGVPRYLLAAHDRLLFAKLGPQATVQRVDERRDPPRPGYLVALDLLAQKKRRFEIRLDEEEWGAGWTFEGPPVHDGANLYVVLRRRDNLQSQCHVACFEVRWNDARLRWKKLLVAAESPGQGQLDEFTHSLLTFDQGVLYLNTNLGAIAAVRAADGKLLWLVRYERSPLNHDHPDRSGRHFQRDLTPCLLHRDLLIAAPADSDRLFALDAATGSVVWSTESQQAVDVVHLLGTAGDKLIASGDRLYWFDLPSGRMLRRFPERVQESLRGYGRGVIAGSQVFWPTPEQIYVFDAATMRPSRQPIDLASLGLTGGNLLIVDGVLLIATADRLVAFDEYGPRGNAVAEKP